MMRFVFLLLTTVLCTAQCTPSHQKKSFFILPNNGSIGVANITQVDSLFPLSFAGFEGLYYKVCDSTFSICYKLIPSSQYTESIYKNEYGESSKILDKVGYQSVDYFALNFYMPLQDSSVRKFVIQNYLAQGINVTITEKQSVDKYGIKTIEHTIFAPVAGSKKKIGKYNSGITNGMVNQIILLKTNE